MTPPNFGGRLLGYAIDHGCTWLNVVPTIVSYLLEGVAPEREQLSSIRFCRSASAALPSEHHRAFEAKFGVGIIETMGLTETVAPAFSNPIEPQLRKIGSVGRASGCDARVVDPTGAPIADGSIGEIVIWGPQVTPGYYKDPDASAAAFCPGHWLRSGDLGYRDTDGFFFITGRIKELIIKGGENIAPREIDEALLRHPAVLDAAAVGIPIGTTDRTSWRASSCATVSSARSRICAISQPRTGSLQDPEGDSVCQRPAARTFGEGAAFEACRTRS